MLVLGHTGITLGAAVLLKSTLTHPSQNDLSGGRARWLTFLEKIDIRLLLIGSLLPDIVDKPIGQFFFRGSLSSGRVFSHTLLFLILITLAGLYLYRSRARLWLLTLSFGTFTHFAFDQMWLSYQTLLWPLYGWSFAKYDFTNWVQQMFSILVTDPTVYVPELIGGAILIWFALSVVRRKQVYTFIRNVQA